MNSKTLSKWHQDPGWDSGTMTFCFQSGDVSVHLKSFKDAHALQRAIQQELAQVRYDARAELINHIARIQP